MKKTIMTGLPMLLAVGVALADKAPLLKYATMQEGARYGATHVLEITADNLDVATANAAQVFTNTVVAPYSLEFRGYILDAPFDSSTDTNAFSIALSAGTSSATTKWISGLQAAYDQTPTVKASFGTDYTVATTTIGPATNLLTSTSTVTSPRLNAQTSNATLHFTVGAPGSGRKLSSITSGSAKFYFRIIGPDK